MPANIENAFIELYTSEVLNTYQDMGYVLPSFCKQGAVMAEKLYWHKLAKLDSGDVVKNDFSDHVLAGQEHSMVSIETENREVPSGMHSLQMLKTNVDFRQGYIKNQLALLGRRADQQVVTAFNAGKNASILGPGFDVGLAVDHIYQLRETFDMNYIPNDGRRNVFVTPRIWSQLLQIEEFVNADYLGADQLPLAGMGLTAKAFQTFNWIQYIDAIRTPLKANGDPWVSGTDAANLRVGNVARCMAWHEECMGHGTTSAPATTITYENIKSAWAIITRQAMGATVVDNVGVYAFDVDELQPVAA